MSVRRLELVATDNIFMFDATPEHQWISCCAEAAPVTPGASLFSGMHFQHVEYLPASSARRNRAQAAQPTQLVDELTRRRRLLSKTVRAESIEGASYNQAPPISQKLRSCGYVGNVDSTSAPQRTNPCLHTLCSG